MTPLKMQELFLSRFILFLIAFSLFGCTPNLKPEKEGANESYYYGEQIDGPANVRDTINGRILFQLRDLVNIQAASFVNGWCDVGVLVVIDSSEYQNGEIAEGSDLKNSNGEIIGKTLTDLPIWVSYEDKGGFLGYIGGTTARQNIQEASLIENRLISFISENGRGYDRLSEFIDQYGLEPENRFPPFDGYYLYENWITDPSPGFRICLLFEDAKLQGILHSRDLSLPSSNIETLWDGTKVLFFNDYPESKRVKYKEFMSAWLNGVD